MTLPAKRKEENYEKKYRLFQIDSFTKDKFTGNPAGVITNAEGLSESEMQKIASVLATYFCPETHGKFCPRYAEYCFQNMLGQAPGV